MSELPLPLVIFFVFFSSAIIIIGLLAYWKSSLAKRGIRLSVKQLCAMSIKKTLTADLLAALELADKNQFFIKPHYLEAHLIAGGNPLRLIQLIIDGKQRGETVSFREAATMELGKVNLETARKLYADFNQEK